MYRPKPHNTYRLVYMVEMTTNAPEDKLAKHRDVVERELRLQFGATLLKVHPPTIFVLDKSEQLSLAESMPPSSESSIADRESSIADRESSIDDNETEKNGTNGRGDGTDDRSGSSASTQVARLGTAFRNFFGLEDDE